MVHALQRIRTALEMGGMVVDTQPVSACPVVEAPGSRLGVLDMREWLRTVAIVDELVEQTIDTRLYSIETERRFIVTDGWDSGPECVESVGSWQGTRVAPALAERVRAVRTPVTVDQEVRLRLLRAR